MKSKNPIRSTRSSPGAHTRWLGSRGAVVAFCCWSRLKCPGPAAWVVGLPPAKRGATARPGLLAARKDGQRTEAHELLWRSLELSFARRFLEKDKVAQTHILNLSR